MSGALIENNDGPNEIIIEGRNGATAISMQMYQDIYNQITGKSEEIVKISKKSIRANLDDIRQLDIKIKQLLEQYKVISINSTFTIYFDKNQKETHSSIDKFTMLNSSINGCTESVLARYNFSVVLPQTGRAQNYAIAVRLVSRIAAQKKLMEELPFGSVRAIAGMFSAKTCEIKVEYVDYAVARTVISAFDEWVDALDESKSSKYLSLARRFSHLIPPLFKYGSLIIFSWVFLEILPSRLSGSLPVHEVARFGVIGFLFLFFAYKISAALGRFVENSIDSSSDISYLNITKGDQKSVSEACKENRLAMVKAVFGACLSFVLNFAAKYLAAHL